MKTKAIMNTKTNRTTLAVTFALSTLPAMAWSHPGHGLDGLWGHDMLHGATAVFAIALVALLTVRFVRQRKARKHR